MNRQQQRQSDEEDDVRRLLRQTLAPVDPELGRDLWPQMLERLQRRSVVVPWFDWALLAALIVCGLLYPGLIPLVLYHM